MGRPAKDIDAERVRKLAKLGRNQDEIADFFGVTQSVVSERFRSDFHLGRAESKISLRRSAIQTSDAGFGPHAHSPRESLPRSDRST